MENQQGKMIIDIQSADSDNVKLNLPLGIAKLAINVIPSKHLSQLKELGVDLREILNNISELVGEMDEDLVNICSAKGDKVRIYLSK